MVVLPEIQQERKRQDIQSLVAARSKFTGAPHGGRKIPKWGEERNGNSERRGNHWQKGQGDELPKPEYPTGLPLNSMESEMEVAHRLLGSDGEALRYGFSAHSGLARMDSCAFSHQSRIKAD